MDARVGCRRRSAANKNRVPRTIPEEGGPIPLHRDRTIQTIIYLHVVKIQHEEVGPVRHRAIPLRRRVSYYTVKLGTAYSHATHPHMHVVSTDSEYVEMETDIAIDEFTDGS